MGEFAFQELLPLAEDDTPYRRLSGDYVTSAEFDGAQRVGAVFVAGGHDDLGVGGLGHDGFQRRQSLAGALIVRWKAEVEDDDRRLIAPEEIQRGGTVPGHKDRILRETPAKLPLQAGIVLDEKQTVGDVVH